MNEPGYIVAGPCWVCGRVFTFNPHLVPSVPIDPNTNRPADLGGDPERAIRQPVCALCIEVVNPRRQVAGLPPIEVLPGAYDPVEGLPD